MARAGVATGSSGVTAVGIGSKEIFAFVKFERPVKAASADSPERGAFAMRARYDHSEQSVLCSKAWM